MLLKKLLLIKLDWESIRHVDVAELTEFYFLSHYCNQNWNFTSHQCKMQFKKLLLIKLEWESILEVFYRSKSTNNT